MCLFVNTLRPEVTLRIWDMFLNEGSKVLFRISAALFKIHEKELLAVKDAGDLFTILRKLGKNVVDADVLIAAGYKSYQPLNPSSFSTSKSKLLSSSSSSSTTAPRPVSRSFSDGNQSNSANSSPVRGPLSNLYSSSPSTSGFFRKNKAQDTSNPRLRFHSDAGKVPSLLEGVGLAHMGPIVGKLEETRYKSVADISSYVWDSADGGALLPSVELDSDMLKSANEMSDSLLSAEVYESRKEKGNADSTSEDGSGKHGKPKSPESSTPSTPVKEKSQERITSEDAEGVKAEGGSVSVEETNKESGDAGGTATEEKVDGTSVTPSLNVNSNDSYDQTLFTDPSLLLNHVRDSIVVSRNSNSFSQYSTTSTQPSKAKRNRKYKYGEFTFTRADIAVWRSTFRPGLQDRYERMEKARAEYLKEKERNSISSFSKANAIVQSLSNTNTSGSSSIITDSEVKEKESESGLVTPLISTAALDISLPSSAVPPVSSLSPQSRSSSFHEQSNKNAIVDVEAINTNYDIDHQFENS
jgi:hypothetical protein